MSNIAEQVSNDAPPNFNDDPSLRASLRDGMGHASMLGFGESFLGAFGVFLHASVMQVGMLATLPQLSSALFQNLGVWCIERFTDRREILVRGIIVNAMSWLTIGTLALVATPGNLASNVLICLALVYFGSAGFTNPVWNSLIGDLVPPHARGRFFGLRNRLNGLCTFSAMLLGGRMLAFGEQRSAAHLSFTFIFLFAATGRFISAYWTTRYANPPFQFRHEHRFSFIQFLRRAPWSNFAKFVFFCGTINFGVAFSSPYFALYMLRDLRFDYGTFAGLTAIVTVTQFLTMQFWGRISDQFGNRKILSICAYGVCVSPVLWVFSSELWFLALAQIYAGVVWAGYNLASTNFIFDAVTPPKIARCAAYQSLVNAGFFLLGSFSGALLSKTVAHSPAILPAYFRAHSPLLFIFLVSGLLRFIAVMTLLPRFREVRVVQPIRTKELLFRIVEVTPLIGSSFDVISSRWRKRGSEDTFKSSK